jgi:hypothetical protein
MPKPYMDETIGKKLPEHKPGKGKTGLESKKPDPAGLKYMEKKKYCQVY